MAPYGKLTMKPAAFRYHMPRTIDEAVAILAEVAPQDGRILAGGQSLVPTMAFRLARPPHLVDINGVEALKRLAVEGGKLCIGACVRHSAFQRAVVEGPLGGLLSAVAVARGAEMVARSLRGTRVIPAHEFFAGIMTPTLQDDELLTEVPLPLLPADTRFGFYEFNRRAGDFAIAMALTVYRLDDGKIIAPRLVVGGAEPHARRLAETEQVLAGRLPGAESFAAAADSAARAVDPMEDATNTAEYRRDVVRAVMCRALDQSAL